MRKLLLFFFIFFSLKVIAQPLNNEWIDYSKTYYKFKVGTTGLYRISQSALASVNLQNTPAEQFQLWRNGAQVPLYTTTTTGLLGNNGFIEFWGVKNDGKPDKYLYRDSNNQLSDRVSLETDTAAYYLTVNSSPATISTNLRVTDVANANPTTLPTPEPYFIHTYNIDFQDNVNPGYAISVGEYVYSSAYDMGEFCSSASITGSSPLTVPLANLNAAAVGLSATLKGAFVATIYGNRTVQLGFNNDNTNVLLDTLSGLTPDVSSISVPISTLLSNPSSLNLKIISNDGFDAVVCNYIQLTYPHTFNFGGQTSFSFSLPSSSTGNYLKITNFNKGAAIPVLYDFTNNVRYTAITSVPDTLQFLLPASATVRSLVLVSQDAVTGNIKSITSLQQRNFINYASTNYQGDYLIISNKLLGLTDGAVEAYRAYRSSAYNAKVYDIDELEDQFAFGIKKHPLSIKNFVRFASSAFAKKPTFVFLIGKGVSYDQYRLHQSSRFADKLNLVPTWGWPASDAMLVSTNLDPNPTIGFGRISAVSQAEVTIYLNKVKEYEGQLNMPNTIADWGWMKNVIHITGADDAGLYPLLKAYLTNYERTIKGPSYGGLVYNFDKTTTGAVTAVASTQLVNLISNGVGLITYFGHGSNTVLDYANINDPYAFSNKGKYPMFLTNGCSVGNFFDYDTMRMNIINTLSEKYVFAPNQGSIGVIGNTHFGLTNYLDNYSTGFYNSLSTTGYNKEVAHNMLAGIEALKGGGSFSSFGPRIHAEETVLAGDPAIKIYASAKPDYAIEQRNVVVSPSILSVSNTEFKVKAYLYNIGKATNDTTVNVLIVRVYPNSKTDTLFNKRIDNFNYNDSVVLTVPIVGSRDKGSNQIIVTINGDKSIDEVTFNNNSVTSTFAIFDNGITPIYPYNYAIVNKPNIQLIASTANPISALSNYVMELDTTALFNSPLKVTKTVTSVGGSITFDPAITFTDSTVYYWRVAQVPTSGAYVYSTSSFVYLNGSSTGFNQSHVYQHQESTFNRMYLDSASRRWMYSLDSNNIVIRSAVFSPTGNNEDANFQTFINGMGGPQSACVGHSLIFNVYDPVTLLPLHNQSTPSTTDQGKEGGFMNSATFCGKKGREYNFEYQLFDITGRRAAKDFMNWVPEGYIVTARLNYDDPTPFADVWKSDSLTDGAGNTLYSTLKSVGFSEVDSFNRARTFVLIYKKNMLSFKTRWMFSNGTADAINLSLNIAASDTLGYVTSPQFGPSSSWKQLKWRGASLETKGGDALNIYVVGVDNAGNQTQLMTLDNSKQETDITSIDAMKYPYLKLMMRNADSINLTPYQLRYWRLTGDMIPEGSLAPNIKFMFADTINKTSNKSIDTFQVGQQISVAFAFKNISDVSFTDSMLVNVQVVDNNNNTVIIPVSKLKRLVAGDTAVIYFTIDASNFSGNNTLYVNVNPNNTQPEQYHFNNFLYKSFYITPDNTNPVLDVTFDGVHILNDDIVSSKPDIKVKLFDDARYNLLNDTSLLSVKLIYPDNSTHAYSFNTDTLRFTPATNVGSENAALVDFTPYLPVDGTYQLLVSGKNRSGKPAGLSQYRVQFVVKNTPMISNVFNYPNPFTTSTAFVFTLTGSEVPQDMKIEILTVTGKIVKEITKEQLGNVHIGNNITTYKWDGTDMFGAKLGNGVYLYRVVTKLNGNNLDKYTGGKGGTNTDQFFKGGYGKMYLLR